jgi:nucleotidyltransferase/DNA polymerase involved in DNA repair
MLSNITSEKTYQKWMRNASHYVGVPLTEDSEVQFVVESPSELLALPGIGLKTVEKLNVLNIFTLNDLISFEEPEILRKVLRMSESRFTAFIKKITGNS